MASAIGGLFGGTQKAAGPSAEMLKAQNDQASAASAREAETKAQEAARRRALFGRGAGAGSLLSGAETGVDGVPLKTTLGG